METFDINLSGEALTVLPDEKGLFTIFKGDEQVAVLCPDTDKDIGTRWHPCDGINDELAEQIGQLIEDHDL